jgi:hypothetical protein
LQAASFVKSAFVPTLLDKLDPYNTEVYQNFKPSKGKQHQKDTHFALRCQLGRTSLARPPALPLFRALRLSGCRVAQFCSGSPPRISSRRP